MFGGLGIVEMPSARMAPDGELSTTVFVSNNTQRYNFDFQVLPWLSASFRYTGLNNYDPLYPTYYDRSYGLKLRLWDEGLYRPALAVGFRDFLGTGIYSGEYVVVSKVVGDVDLTAGMGWGRMASRPSFRNPLTLISKRFETRGSDTGFAALQLARFFHGKDVGLFGGATWQTPIDGLRLSAEYSSDAYPVENQRRTFTTPLPVNVGIHYSPYDWVDLGAHYLYGRYFGATITLRVDPKTPTFEQRVSPPVTPVEPRSDAEQMRAVQSFVETRNTLSQGAAGSPKIITRQRASDQLADVLTSAGMNIDSFEIRGEEIFLAARSSSPVMANCAAYAELAQAALGGLKQMVITDATRPNAPIKICTPAAGRTASFNASRPLVRVSAETFAAGQLDDLKDAVAEDNIRKAAAAQNISVKALAVWRTEALIYFQNTRYGETSKVIGRLLRILAANTSPDVELFRLVTVVDNLPVSEMKVPRSGFERALASHSGAELLSMASFSSPPVNVPLFRNSLQAEMPQISWAISPVLRQSLFDPANPLRLQLLVEASAKVNFTPELFLSGSIEANIYDTFDIQQDSNSELPHVRSDFKKYYEKGINGIGSLYAGYQTKIAPDVFARVNVGYLESMYAGVGGEILWRPQNTRWALGLDLYQVWQRKYDRLFGVLNYNVLTGHASVYYQSPYYGLNFRVRAGRYLAGDHGATFEVTRRFSTGVEIGGFATLTNVPFAKFGEGSFDRGIIIRIPLGWAAPIETQSAYNADLRLVQRDGGQRVANDAVLYDRLRRADVSAIGEHEAFLLDP